jgi:hypothetical protein
MRALSTVRASLGAALILLAASRARADAPSSANPAAAANSATASVTAAAADPAAPANVTAPAPVVAPPVTAPVAAPRPVQTKSFPELKPPTLSHFLQFGIAVLPGTGYRGIFPYQEMVNCGQPGKRVCTGRLPFFLDVQPSFGFANHWDLLVDLRFGLETDFTRDREFAVAPGFRYWVDPQEHSKFFATIQAAFDTTSQHDPTIHNNDVALRNSNGFMYEIMRNFGVYLQFGETIGFVRWLRFEIDGGLGVQARLP